MPWKRAKALPPPDNTLFNECFRIQREASEAAGHHIPLIVENVRGAQKWVGRASWKFGSYYLWGDVPALMPVTIKIGTERWPEFVKGVGIGSKSWAEGNLHPNDPRNFWSQGVKQHGSGREWFVGEGKISRMTSSKSESRKAASAMIAKIPFPLAQHIARTFKTD